MEKWKKNQFCYDRKKSSRLNCLFSISNNNHRFAHFCFHLCQLLLLLSPDWPFSQKRENRDYGGQRVNALYPVFTTHGWNSFAICAFVFSTIANETVFVGQLETVCLFLLYLLDFDFKENSLNLATFSLSHWRWLKGINGEWWNGRKLNVSAWKWPHTKDACAEIMIRMAMVFLFSFRLVSCIGCSGRLRRIKLNFNNNNSNKSIVVVKSIDRLYTCNVQPAISDISIKHLRDVHNFFHQFSQVSVLLAPFA